MLAFSDAFFAIAMTLLVVGIEVPDLTAGDSVGELAEVLNDDLGSFVSFVISFAVIGRYWVAHHSFCARLAAVDGGLIGLNLVYLMFIAFLPVPHRPARQLLREPALGGRSTRAPWQRSAAWRWSCSAMRSGEGLFEHPPPEDVYRWGVRLSLSPVIFFVISIPLAFVSTTLAVLSWFLAIPYQVFEARKKPAHADEYL